jgi:hypothetical protein
LYGLSLIRLAARGKYFASVSNPAHRYLIIHLVLKSNKLAAGLLIREARRTGRMAIAKITGQGLMAIAFSVALLWICLIGERVMVHRAHLERQQLILEIERLQHRQRTEPVSAPARFIPPRTRTAAG